MARTVHGPFTLLLQALFCCRAVGNVLRNNYIHDLGGGDAEHVNTMGIYLDDCDCGDTLVGNVFYRAGRAIMIGGGRDNPVLNNLVVDCPIGLHIDSRGMTWKQWNNPADSSWCLEAKAQQFNYTQPPWSTRYPRLAAIMHEEPREPLALRAHLLGLLAVQPASFARRKPAASTVCICAAGWPHQQVVGQARRQIATAITHFLHCFGEEEIDLLEHSPLRRRRSRMAARGGTRLRVFH